MSTKPVRDLLGRALAWHEAHATFEDAVKDIPANLRGARPEGLPYSAWELLEHLRIGGWAETLGTSRGNRFRTVLPPSFLADGPNEIEVFVIQGPGPDPALAPMTRSGP